MLELRLQPEVEFEQELAPGYNGFVVVLEGSSEIGAASFSVKPGQVAWLSKTKALSAVRFRSGKDGLRALLFAGLPLGEPVAARGPFVMNTDEELRAGFAEFRQQGNRFRL